MLIRQVILATLFMMSMMDFAQAQAVSDSKGNSTSQAIDNEKIEANKKKYLTGLRKIESDADLKRAEALTEAKGVTKYDILYLGEDYKSIHNTTFSNFIEYGGYQWAADVYVNDDFVIAAKVIRKGTQADKDKAIATLRALVEEVTPQSIEREKIIASQLGKPAPFFSVTDVDGVKYDLNELRSKVVVLNFWFIGCGPCKKEMPELNKMVEKYKGKDVVFLAFEVNNNTADKIKAVTKESFHFTQIPSRRGEISEQYKIKTYPTSYVIDQSGIIRFGLAAYNPFKLPEMDMTIENLLKNKNTK